MFVKWSDKVASGKKSRRRSNWKRGVGEVLWVFKGTRNVWERRLGLPQYVGQQVKGLGTSKLNPAIFMEEEEIEKVGSSK